MTAARDLVPSNPDLVDYIGGADIPRGNSTEPPMPPDPGGDEMDLVGEAAQSWDEGPSEAVTNVRPLRRSSEMAPGAYDRLPPHNMDSERAVLGSILIDRGAIAELADSLTPDDFYRQAHGRIYAAMLELHRAGELVDILTVADVLERAGELVDVGGASYLSTLSNDTPTAVHVAQYGRIVREAAASRRIIGVAGKIAELGYERDTEAAARAIELLQGVSEASPASSSNIMARTGARCLSEVSSAPAQEPLLGFLDPDGHTILHGMGGVGKGLLACHWITRLVAEGQRVLIVDYEGHPGEWARRIQGLGGADAQASVCYVSPSSADWTGHRGAIWTQAAELHALAVEWGATYVLVDSIIPACGALDPLKPEAAGQYAAGLVRIGLPSLSLAHVTKADSPAYPFGSIFWHNLARMSWSLTREGETVQLVSRKANNYDRLGRYVVSATWFEGLLGEVSLTPYSVVLADRIAEVLADGPLTVTEIVGRLAEDDGSEEIKANSLRHALNRGRQAGRFTCEGDRWSA